jgi:primosomal protein N' (replication factor Y)
VEAVLNRLFANHTIVRLDRDSTQRKGSLENFLTQINQGQADIILGTQILAKGHHFANVTLAVILDVDSGLFSIDFHAPEKLAQLIVQVAGRAGRAEKPGRVILQTRHPEHPLLTTLIQDGYNRFAQTALAERKQAGLPPFSHQALFRASAVDVRLPPLFLEALSQLARQHLKSPMQILGPVPAPMSKRVGLYHYQLLLQSSKRKDLHSLLDALIPEIEKQKPSQKVRWSLDVDPLDLY